MSNRTLSAPPVDVADFSTLAVTPGGPGQHPIAQGAQDPDAEFTGCASYEFRVHQVGQLRQQIRDQAGTLLKAICEAAMNAIDHSASSFWVDITKKRVVLSDNGTGFANAREIREKFEEFALPHKEGDAAFGRFRAGRGQLFYQGTNTWHTNGHVMRVDAVEWARSDDQNMLRYDLAEAKIPYPGCRIIIDLANPVPNVTALVADVLDSLRYAPISVCVNKEHTIGWAETRGELAPTKFKAFYAHWVPNAALKVYNQGVLAFVYPTGTLRAKGMSGGVVCTQPPELKDGEVVGGHSLALNTARNEVRAECPIWIAIQEVAREEARKARAALDARADAEAADAETMLGLFSRFLLLNVAQTDAEAGRRLFHGLLEAAEAETRHRTIAWIPDVNGDKRSMNAAAKFPALVSACAHNRQADQLMQRRLAFPVNVAALLRSLPGGVNLPDAHVMAALSCVLDRPVSNIESLHVAASYDVLSAEEVRKQQHLRIGMEALKCASWYARYALRDAASVRRASQDERASYMKERVLRIGRHDRSRSAHVACGWTDGATYVAISEDLLRPLRGLRTSRCTTDALTRILFVMLHEHCHDTNSAVAGHGHSEAFFATYHDATMQLCAHTVVARMQQRLTQAHMRERRQREREAARKKLLRAAPAAASRKRRVRAAEAATSASGGKGDV